MTVPALGPCRYRFPDPATGLGPEGVLCLGSDFEPETLYEAYRLGIFPWPSPEHGLVAWCSPDPRPVLPLATELRWSRSVRRAMRSEPRTSVDAAFRQVVDACADRDEGTWIVPQYVAGFERLHALGLAHSLEVWSSDGALVGGIYGIALGTVFTAESMFHRESNASKVAFARLAERLAGAGFELLDGEVPSPHLASLGCVEMSRAEFLERLARGRTRTIAFPV